MAGPSTSYSSGVNFLVVQQTNNPNIPGPVRAEINNIYKGLQQIIQTFLNNCGISPKAKADQEALAGNPATILRANLGRLYVIASEDILFGAMINLWNDAGVLKARNADGTDNTKPADAYCSSTSGILLGEAGEVIVGSGLASIAGLTIGDRYYLSTTPGLVSNAPAVAAGNIEQYIGVALTDTILLTNIQYWIQH